MNFVANFALQVVICFIIGTVVYMGIKLAKLAQKPETKPQFLSLLVYNFFWFASVTCVIVLFRDTPIDFMYIVKFFGALFGFVASDLYTKTKHFNEE